MLSKTCVLKYELAQAKMGLLVIFDFFLCSTFQNLNTVKLEIELEVINITMNANVLPAILSHRLNIYKCVQSMT